MRVAVVRQLDGSSSWTVLGPQRLPVPPVERFLAHMTAVDRWPQSVRSTRYRWPLFAAEAREAGVMAMICTSMKVSGRSLGVLTLLSSALSSRDVIGQAKGILMERLGITPDAAFAVLVQASSRTNTKLRAVCEKLCTTEVLVDGSDDRRRRTP